MAEIDIKQEPMLPFSFQVMGGLMVFGCFLFVPVWGISEIGIWDFTGLVFFLILGIFLLTTRYGLKINVKNSTYTSYTWFFGIKMGKPEKFHHIEKFYINQVTEKSKLGNKGTAIDIRDTVFKVYMLLDTNKEVHVETDRIEERLKIKVDQYIDIVRPVYQINK